MVDSDWWLVTKEEFYYHQVSSRTKGAPLPANNTADAFREWPGSNFVRIEKLSFRLLSECEFGKQNFLSAL